MELIRTEQKHLSFCSCNLWPVPSDLFFHWSSIANNLSIYTKVFVFQKVQYKDCFLSAEIKRLRELLLSVEAQELLIGQQVSHPSIQSLMHQQSLGEPLELFEACADLNASGGK